MFRAAEMVGEGTEISVDSDDGPVPRAFVAATDTLYEAPLTSPITVHDINNAEQSVLVTVGACADSAITE